MTTKLHKAGIEVVRDDNLDVLLALYDHFISMDVPSAFSTKSNLNVHSTTLHRQNK